jgi:activator of HSP90 ATPase
MKTRIIRQKVGFNATPHDVYEALMDSEKHAGFTESEAKVSRAVGGKMMAYDGYIRGENLELVPDRRIVQSWRASDWPKGHYSKAIFEFRRSGEGTELSFRQEGVPEEQYDELAKGWHDFYWDKMKRMFDGR